MSRGGRADRQVLQRGVQVGEEHPLTGQMGEELVGLASPIVGPPPRAAWSCPSGANINLLNVSPGVDQGPVGLMPSMEVDLPAGGLLGSADACQRQG